MENWQVISTMNRHQKKHLPIRPVPYRFSPIRTFPRKNLPKSEKSHDPITWMPPVEVGIQDAWSTFPRILELISPSPALLSRGRYTADSYPFPGMTRRAYIAELRICSRPCLLCSARGN